MIKALTWLCQVLLFSTLLGTVTSAYAETMRLAVTTSFENSGLADVLLPQFKADTDIDVQLIVVGSGQALRLGRAGDVDAILVHSRNAEDAFVEEGFGTHRREIMTNDFIIVGPETDPAALRDADDIGNALRRISTASAQFVSRGDDSGTHRRERRLWETAGQNPDQFDPAWYREVGAGMGATLNTASAMNAYALSDRGSWLNFANRGELTVLFEGGSELLNQYAYITVSPSRHPHVNHKAALALETWLAGEKGQALIGDYRIDGERLFTPNARAR